tara:strand:+ start:2663 stop:2899 length:237 start_codon:yes stop_codon:yes gene_type:complete
MTVNDGFTLNIACKALPRLKALYDRLEALHHEASLLEDEGADYAGADKIDEAMSEVGREMKRTDDEITAFMETAPEYA